MLFTATYAMIIVVIALYIVNQTETTPNRPTLGRQPRVYIQADRARRVHPGW